jgi:hypothetical protein
MFAAALCRERLGLHRSILARSHARWIARRKLRTLSLLLDARMLSRFLIFIFAAGMLVPFRDGDVDMELGDSLYLHLSSIGGNFAQDLLMNRFALAQTTQPEINIAAADVNHYSAGATVETIGRNSSSSRHG